MPICSQDRLKAITTSTSMHACVHATLHPGASAVGYGIGLHTMAAPFTPLQGANAGAIERAVTGKTSPFQGTGLWPKSDAGLPLTGRHYKAPSRWVCSSGRQVHHLRQVPLLAEHPPAGCIHAHHALC